jgi:hypothetical protein
MERIGRKWSIVIVVTSFFIGLIASVAGSRQPDNFQQPLIHISIDHTSRMVYSEEK